MKTEAAAGFRGTKLYDVLIATPLLLWYALGISLKLVPDMRAELRGTLTLDTYLTLAAHAGTIAYMGVIIVVVILRRVPVARSRDIWPRLLALVTAYMSVSRWVLPYAHLSAPLAAVSAILSIGGSIASVIVLLWLGRSFSILPEARKLVTGGPYRLVRHPLYLVEEIGSLGVMLQFLQPWSLLLEIVNLALQLWRMQREEIVLSQAFPEYSEYASRTRRLIPGVY